jgi:hypothetical protein
MTSILVALKIAFEVLGAEPYLDRELTLAVHLLCYDSYRLYVAGRDAGVEWPPLLDQDLERMAIATRSFLAGTGQG